MSSTRTRRVTTATLAVAAGAAPLLNAAAATAQDATSVQTTTPQVTSAASGVGTLTRALPVSGVAGSIAPQLNSLTNPGAAQQLLNQVVPASSMVAGAPLNELPNTLTDSIAGGAPVGGLTSSLTPLGRSSLGLENTSAATAAANAAANAAEHAAAPLAGAASGVVSKLPLVGGVAAGLPGGSIAGALPNVDSLGNVTSELPAASTLKSVTDSLPLAAALRNSPLAAVAGSVTPF